MLISHSLKILSIIPFSGCVEHYMLLAWSRNTLLILDDTWQRIWYLPIIYTPGTQHTNLKWIAPNLYGLYHLIHSHSLPHILQMYFHSPPVGSVRVVTLIGNDTVHNGPYLCETWLLCELLGIIEPYPLVYPVMIPERILLSWGPDLRRTCGSSHLLTYVRVQ